jgi:cysteine desulfurase
MRKKSIYLDYQATTPVDPRILDAMRPFFAEEFGNPHSSSHIFGNNSARAVASSRAKVAQLFKCGAEDVIFTSGATEANNLALLGVFGQRSPIRKFVTSAIEHPSVLEPLEQLKRRGAEVVVLPVSRSGFVDTAALAHELDGGPTLVSVMAANNEIGVVQPLREISDLCRRAGAWLHTDASQLVGKQPIDLASVHWDLLTLSSHKIYGPKGVGALIASYAVREVLSPLTFGGGQENGLRAGTVPTSLVVGFGIACELAADLLSSEPASLEVLRDRFIAELQALNMPFEINGTMQARLPNNLSVRVKGIDAITLFAMAPGVAVSSGSACSSASAHVEPSHVLKAIGLSDDEARSTIRISVGRFTTIEQVVNAASQLAAGVAKLRELGAIA